MVIIVSTWEVRVYIAPRRKLRKLAHRYLEKNKTRTFESPSARRECRIASLGPVYGHIQKPTSILDLRTFQFRCGSRRNSNFSHVVASPNSVGLSRLCLYRHHQAIHHHPRLGFANISTQYGLLRVYRNILLLTLLEMVCPLAKPPRHQRMHGQRQRLCVQSHQDPKPGNSPWSCFNRCHSRLDLQQPWHRIFRKF